MYVDLENFLRGVVLVGGGFYKLVGSDGRLLFVGGGGANIEGSSIRRNTVLANTFIS